MLYNGRIRMGKAERAVLACATLQAAPLIFDGRTAGRSTWTERDYYPTRTLILGKAHAEVAIVSAVSVSM
jgi:hypothetical protein